MATGDQNDAVALATELLSAIGDEALEGTGGDRYRAGQPLLNDPSAPPAQPKEDGKPVEPPSGTPAVEGADAPSSPPAPAKPDLVFGQYKSLEEAERGLHETRRYAREAKEEAASAQAELARLRSQFAPQRPESTTNPFDDLSAIGVPKEPLEAAMRAIVQETIQKTFGPAAQRVQADQQILKEFPQYGERFEEMQQFVESVPDLKAKVDRAEADGQYLLAREVAWLNFERQIAQTRQAELEAQGQQRVETAQSKMADAAVTKPSQATARTQKQSKGSPNDLPDEDYQRLINLAKSGHSAPLWRETIGWALAQQNPEMFGPEGGP